MKTNKHVCLSLPKYRNWITTLGIITIATIISLAFFHCTNNTTNIAIIYMLSVVLTARYTDGYLSGIVASLIGVIFVNFVFTYPYLELNFTMDGYPVTFAGMLVISGITSTMTSHLKLQSIILNDREKRLLEAEKETMRANLLRAISHDLRTPLTGIIGTGQTYLENESQLSNEEKLNMVQNICEDSHWLLNMVENLLTVTRIHDTGASNIVTKSMEPLEEVVSEAVQRFRRRLPDINVTVSIPEEFVMLPMDATLIEQVIINLLENSVYHSLSTEPIQFYVKIHNDFAHFHIRDFGVGIQKEQLDKIFDGYCHDSHESIDSHKGMGIGLSICKTIVLAHHGEIYAENHSCGVEFIFTLPLHEI